MVEKYYRLRISNVVAMLVSRNVVRVRERNGIYCCRLARRVGQKREGRRQYRTARSGFLLVAGMAILKRKELVKEPVSGQPTKGTEVEVEKSVADVGDNSNMLR